MKKGGERAGGRVPRIALWPVRGLRAVLEGRGRDLAAVLTWKPPAVNAEEAGGYLVERRSWWPGVEPETALLTRTPVRGCAFRDGTVVPDRVNEYRVRPVHRRFGAIEGPRSFPAAVYGFAFMRYGEMVEELKALGSAYPEVCRIVDAGPASMKPYRVWCAVLGTDTSDLADRPGLFLAGTPHASEIEGGDMCMGLVRETLRRWKSGDPVIRRVLETTQIRIVPFYNPCGRLSNETGFPGGVRKTAPARMLDIPADPLRVSNCWPADTTGGLDPNRTFDVGWEAAVDTDPRSGCYPGKRPCAAPETRALVKMAFAVRPQISVNYHGPCGYPLLTGDFPDGTPPPDREFHREVGREFAKRSDPDFADDVPEESPHPSSNLNGVAQNWFHKAFYGAHLLPEGFCGQVPADPRVLPVAGSDSIAELVESNMRALVWMAERLHGAGIAVHVRDGDGRPLEAEVAVPGRMSAWCLAQKTGRRHGDYRRILPPGVYAVEISARGYRTRRFDGLRVADGGPASLDVVLERSTGGRRHGKGA